MTRRLFLLVGVANRGVLQGPVCGLDEQEVQNSIEQPCLEHVPTFFTPSTWQGNEHFGHVRGWGEREAAREEQGRENGKGNASKEGGQKNVYEKEKETKSDVERDSNRDQTGDEDGNNNNNNSSTWT
ncbi:hypothetical protein WN48_09900 [Eufriesea mexicana]|nr:hypothetical protein WN48_09900 [Eufriesea mexicana]